MHVRSGTVNVDGLKVFYHSAGAPSAPVGLLQHGGEAPAKYQKWYGAALGSATPVDGMGDTQTNATWFVANRGGT